MPRTGLAALAGLAGLAGLPPAPAVAGEHARVAGARLYAAPQLRPNAALVVVRLDRRLRQRDDGTYRGRVLVGGQPAPLFGIAGERQRPCYGAWIYGDDRTHPLRLRAGRRYRVRVRAGGALVYDRVRVLGGQPEGALQGTPLDC